MDASPLARRGGAETTSDGTSDAAVVIGAGLVSASAASPAPASAAATVVASVRTAAPDEVVATCTTTSQSRTQSCTELCGALPPNAEAECKERGGTFIHGATPCPTDNRVGRCEPKLTGAGFAREFSYKPIVGQPKESCANRGHVWISESFSSAPLAILRRAIVCPPDMVAVAGRLCVDRFETSIVDATTGVAWSPFFTPDPERAVGVFNFYANPQAPPMFLESAPAIPEPPRMALQPLARSVGGVLPQGYLSGIQAAAACGAAGKRLCTEAEWVTACRGEAQRDFPYGNFYEQGTCNVYREAHPSALLHRNAASYHDDPRNHLVEVSGRAFLQPTDATSRCASRWGEDAVIDMVGNLDEWVADADGLFLGGFYSRGTRSGCQSRISTHVNSYWDYSTGTRCCKDPTE